jgi:hypothetical protein
MNLSSMIHDLATVPCRECGVRRCSAGVSPASFARREDLKNYRRDAGPTKPASLSWIHEFRPVRINSLPNFLFQLRNRFDQNVARNRQRARIDLVERVASGMPVFEDGIFKIDDVNRRHIALQK